MIEMLKVNKWFGAFHALKDVDLNVARREGGGVRASGSGKSTLIRLVNRLEEHQSGKVVVDGVELTDDRHHRPCAARSAWCSRASTCSRTSRCSRT